MDNTSPASVAPMEQALAMFLANNEVGMVSVTLTAIVNILRNIISNPKDIKLRTLQKSNKNIAYKISNPSGCPELMFAMGWSLQNDAYFLPPNMAVTTITTYKQRLEVQLEAADRVISEIPRFPLYLPKENDCCLPFVGSARFEVCIGSARGRRPTMEDEVVVVGMGPAHNPNEDFFAVYDGHGGREAAVYAAKNLYTKIGRNFQLNPSEPLKSITAAFEETNAWMLQQRIGSGSTAAISYVVHSTLYTANVGDTRCVLGWKDRKAVRLSFDHKPSVQSEKERIERLGGEVTKKFGVSRVNGVLGVSRAFGDHKLVPFVSAVPHINILELTVETMFLIIACDGLWDEFSDQEAVEIVFEKAATVQNIGEYLSNMAIMRGSQDNVSVVVVFLNPRSALYEDDEEEEDEEEEEAESSDEILEDGVRRPLQNMVFDDGSSEEDDRGLSPPSTDSPIGSPFVPNHLPSTPSNLPRTSSYANNTSPVAAPSSSSTSTPSRPTRPTRPSPKKAPSPAPNSTDTAAPGTTFSRGSLRGKILLEEVDDDDDSDDEPGSYNSNSNPLGQTEAWREEDDDSE